jgi:hypothetical protein
VRHSGRHYTALATALATALITILAGYRSRMRTLLPARPVLVGAPAVGLPVVDLGNRPGARGGEPGLHPLPGSSIRQAEHQLIQPAARVRCLPGPNDLQVNPAARQPEDGPVQAVAVAEGLQDRQPDSVPVKGTVSSYCALHRSTRSAPAGKCAGQRACWGRVPMTAVCHPAPGCSTLRLQQVPSRQPRAAPQALPPTGQASRTTPSRMRMFRSAPAES